MNGYTSKRFECNIVEKRRVQAFYWWVEQCIPYVVQKLSKIL